MIPQQKSENSVFWFPFLIDNHELLRKMNTYLSYRIILAKIKIKISKASVLGYL